MDFEIIPTDTTNWLALSEAILRIGTFITPTIHNELLIGFTNGLSFIQAILDLIQKTQIQILPLDVSETKALAKFPKMLLQQFQQAGLLTQLEVTQILT